MDFISPVKGAWFTLKNKTFQWIWKKIFVWGTKWWFGWLRGRSEKWLGWAFVLSTLFEFIYHHISLPIQPFTGLLLFVEEFMLAWLPVTSAYVFLEKKAKKNGWLEEGEQPPF